MDIWAPLAQGRRPKQYAPGQLIYLQGTQPDEFYYLIRGTVRSFISSENGGERILALHHTGDLMGEASFFDECPRVSSAVAVEESEIVSIGRERLTQVFQQHPELALPMLQYLARTIRLLSGHVDEIMFHPAGQRVARHLLDRVDGRGRLRETHQEIGDAVGASRVTVSRILGEFSRRGWIQTGYGGVTLCDDNALRRYAE